LYAPKAVQSPIPRQSIDLRNVPAEDSGCASGGTGTSMDVQWPPESVSMKLTSRLKVFTYVPTATHHPSDGQETDPMVTGESPIALPGSGVSVAVHVPFERTSNTPWGFVAPA
jgi:hypothetical protein